MVELTQESQQLAPVWAPLEQTARFHLVEQLADVALGDQQRVRELLLADALGRANLGQYVELGRTELPTTQRVSGGAIHLLKDTDEPQSGQEPGPADVTRLLPRG